MLRTKGEREDQLLRILRSGRTFKMSWLRVKLGTTSSDIRKLVFDLEKKGLINVERLPRRTKYRISRV